MRQILTGLSLTCLVAAQATAEAKDTKKDYRAVVTFGGGNGSSYGTAIVIHAPDQVSGFPSEFAFIKSHFTNYPYVLKEQREVHNNRTYDVVTLAAYNWERHVIYFDVSEFVKKK